MFGLISVRLDGFFLSCTYVILAVGLRIVASIVGVLVWGFGGEEVYSYGRWSGGKYEFVDFNEKGKNVTATPNYRDK